MAGTRTSWLSPARAGALGIGLSIALLAAPARADHCDDLAKQLTDQIDGLKLGRTAANVIYLSHPAAKQFRLGCRSRSISNEIYGAADARKPSPAFQQVIAGAAAIIFTIPKPDTLRGVARCFGRLGLLRGNDIKTRFRRLDMHCTRSKTGSTIAISRGKDE